MSHTAPKDASEPPLDLSVSQATYNGKSANFLYVQEIENVPQGQEEGHISEHQLLPEVECSNGVIDSSTRKRISVCASTAVEPKSNVEDIPKSKSMFPICSRKKKSIFTEIKLTPSLASLLHKKLFGETISTSVKIPSASSLPVSLSLHERFRSIANKKVEKLARFCENELYVLLEDGFGDTRTHPFIAGRISEIQECIRTEKLSKEKILGLIQFATEQKLANQQRAAEASIRLHQRLIEVIDIDDDSDS